MKAISAFRVAGKIPSLNELFRMKGASPHEYNRLKKKWASLVASALLLNKVPAFRWAKVRYVLLEKNKRRDPSNIAAAAVKFIEDALVKHCALQGDGWEDITAYSVQWATDLEHGVLVYLEGETFDEPRERIYRRKLEQEAAKGVERKKSTRAGAVGLKKHPKPVGKARRPRGKAAHFAVPARPRAASTPGRVRKKNGS